MSDIKFNSKLVAATDPEYESRIQAALVGIANGTHKNITVAARVHKVARQTLKDRSMGLHMSHRDFAPHIQITNFTIHLLCINTYIHTLHSQVLSIILHSVNFFI
ncbi:hypothetical protein BDR05DRAFT_1004635 [Suillus weaverae]|nr:hypothetical protein BDR05DRAFT_1004635 [Suillus weaverae]